MLFYKQDFCPADADLSYIGMFKYVSHFAGLKFCNILNMVYGFFTWMTWIRTIRVHIVVTQEFKQYNNELNLQININI